MVLRYAEIFHVLHPEEQLRYIQAEFKAAEGREKHTCLSNYEATSHSPNHRKCAMDLIQDFV